MSRDLAALVESIAATKAWARPSYDGKTPREIEGRVILGDSKDGEGKVELELSCSHRKESKQYYAGLQITTVKEDGQFISRSYSLLDRTTGGQLDRVDSPRYSAKALDAFWELQIGKLRDNPELLAQLNLDHNQNTDATADA